MRIGRLALVGLAAVSSALLLACGGGDGGASDEEAYGDAFTEVAQPLNTELIDLGNVLASSSSRKPISAALGRAKVGLKAASDGFAELDPPAEVATAQDDLLEAIDRFEREIDFTRGSLRSASIKEASRAVGDFRVAQQAFAMSLSEIGQELDDAGVPLGEPPEATAG